MNKIIFAVLLVFISISCKKECTEPMGAIVQQEIEVANFNKIIVNTGIELIIKEGDTQHVVIETGENKLDNVSVSVSDEVLEVQADDKCLLSVSLEPVKVYVTSPTINTIRNSSEFTVCSDGILTYPNLTLIVENSENDFLNIGNFDIQVDNQNTKIVSNGISNIFLSGHSESLNVFYYGGIGRFEGKELVAQNVHIFHRAENSLKVNPQQSLTGDIYSIGNIISYNHPPLVDVSEHYEGRLIFE